MCMIPPRKHTLILILPKNNSNNSNSNDNSNSNKEILKEMNVSDHTALKKSSLLYVSFTYSAWTFKEYPILYF